MSKKSPPSKKKGKKYQLELSLTTLFFWCFGLFFLLAWIFVLGVLVGSGLLPHGMESLSGPEEESAGLQLTDKKQSSSKPDVITELEEKKPEFTFYKELTSKKEAAAKKAKANNKEKLNDRILAKKAKEKSPQKSSPDTRKDEIKKSPDREKHKDVADATSDDDYTVQVASLSTEIEAMKMVNRLVTHGYNTYYCKAIINGKKYYRVRCGRFKDRDHAEELKRRLVQKEKISGFVTTVNK
jgi:cell division protein FtsN